MNDDMDDGVVVEVSVYWSDEPEGEGYNPLIKSGYQSCVRFSDGVEIVDPSIGVPNDASKEQMIDGVVKAAFLHGHKIDRELVTVIEGDRMKATYFNDCACN